MIKIMWLVLCLMVVIPGLGAKDFSDEEYYKFPKLFQLDDYDRCLAARGVYCLGTFQLAPLNPADDLYRDMMEYSQEKLHFNRSLLHRGYCVSARCPLDQPSDGNHTRWFERCVDRNARARGLHARARDVKYCTRVRAPETTLDAPKLVFLVVVFCIVFMNFVGSYYDWVTPDDAKKNKYLMAWSWNANWRRLTTLYQDGDSRTSALSPLQGVRVMVMLLVICMHCGLIHYMLYSYNPRYLETVIKHPLFMMVRNGTSVVQVFVMLSSFLLAYNLLVHAQGKPLSLRLLPHCIINRIARITPVYLLVVGFAATWWPELRSGPMWHAVTDESAICRRKFWAHALYINNFVAPDDHCHVQTWFLAVDMQLFVLSCLLTVALSRWARAAVPVLVALFLAACVGNGVFAYLYQWRTMLYIMNPETLRTLYHGERLFTQIYLMPWACLPAALLGLLLAHVHYYLQEIKFNFASHKWLVAIYHSSIPLLVAMIMAGLVTEHWRWEPALAAYVALERPVFGLIAAVCMLGMFHRVQNPVRNFFSWRCWHVIARVSLAALMLHWGAHLTIAASTHQPLYASVWHVIWDWLAAACLTYLAAIPVTMLVELPVHRTVVAMLA